MKHLSTKTIKYELIKPELTDPFSLSTINSNYDLIDTNLGNIGTKKVDEENISDGHIPIYHAATGKYLLSSPPSGSYLDLNNKPSPSVESIDLAVEDAHSHNNKKVLDLLGVSGSLLTYNGTKLIVGNNNCITDEMIGEITSNENTVLDYVTSGTITEWISWITKRIKEISGESHWYSDISSTIKDLWSQCEIIPMISNKTIVCIHRNIKITQIDIMLRDNNNAELTPGSPLTADLYIKQASTRTRTKIYTTSLLEANKRIAGLNISLSTNDIIDLVSSDNSLEIKVTLRVMNR